MDDGKGNFVPISNVRAKEIIDALPYSGVFHIGEELMIKGSRFRVQSIGRNRLKLKLLPKQ